MLPFDAEALFKPILDNANDVVVITTAHDLHRGGPTILYVNPAFSATTGYPPEEAIGQSPRLLRGPQTDPAVNAKIRTALEAGEPIRTELLNYTKDGHPYWVDLNIFPLRNGAGQVTHFAAIQRDISEWKRLEAELTRQATTDSLTSLRNRRAFFAAARTEIARARRYGESLSIISIDLDHFKRINDRHGHAAGDAALARFAEICRRHVREVDLLARIGGEEFALLLPATGKDNAARLAERIRCAVHDVAIIAERQRFALTVSMGVAEYLGDNDSLESMMRRADAALYRAKQSGRDRICVDEPPSAPAALGA